MELTCRGCSALLRVPDDDPRRRVRCNRCRHVNVRPDKSGDDELVIDCPHCAARLKLEYRAAARVRCTRCQAVIDTAAARQEQAGQPTQTGEAVGGLIQVGPYFMPARYRIRRPLLPRNTPRRYVGYRCPHCASQLECPLETLAGKPNQCPACGQTHVVPGRQHLHQHAGHAHADPAGPRHEPAVRLRRRLGARQYAAAAAVLLALLAGTLVWTLRDGPANGSPPAPAAPAATTVANEDDASRGETLADSARRGE